MNRIMEAIENIEGYQKTYLSAGTKLVTITGLVPPRTWGSHAVALAANERYKIRAQRLRDAGKRQTATLSLLLDLKDMEVEHVLATQSEVAWATCFRTKKAT